MAKLLSGKQDVYLEIAARYANFIRLGVLRDGDKLPSVRVAAGELGVNPNTVQKAYVHLEQQGLICSLPKKGAFVTYASQGSATVSDHTDGLWQALSQLKLSGYTKEDVLKTVQEVYEND